MDIATIKAIIVQMQARMRAAEEENLHAKAQAIADEITELRQMIARQNAAARAEARA